VEFENLLQGQHKRAWKHVLHEHFLEPVNVTQPAPLAQSHNLEENFHQAVKLFIQLMLNKKGLGTGNTSIYSRRRIYLPEAADGNAN
jgi:hypothetical protein